MTPTGWWSSFCSDSWHASGWVHRTRSAPDTESTLYWLEQDAALDDTVNDPILGASYPIVNMTEGVDEDTGQAVVYVVTRHSIAEYGWNICYDTSSRLALRMRAVGLTSSRYGFQLFNTSVDLGPAANAPPPIPIPGFPLGAIALGAIAAIVLGVASRRRRGGAALPPPDAN